MSAPRDEEGSTSASLHYGILVNFHTLVRAATAFASFSSEVDTLDLILSRRQRGLPVHSTIALSPSISFSSLPVEVILLVREELRELHLAKTPNAFLEKHRGYFDDWDDDEDYICGCGGDECWGKPDTPRYERSRIARERYESKMEQRADPAKWDDERWDLHIETDCDYCWEMCDNWKALFKDDALTQISIRRLLHSYSLSLAVPSIIGGSWPNARNQSVVISLPSYLSPSSSATSTSKSTASTSAHSHFPPLSRDDDPSPEHQTATVYDSSFFAVTFQDDNRFKRLVRDFDLKVEAPKVGGGAFVSRLMLSTTERNEKVSKLEERVPTGMKTGTAAAVNTAIKPAFMLLHSIIPWS
ncbi:hypothetical protein P7C70_g3534, partial [Phenoliferia sp. Uapishka_3]